MDRSILELSLLQSLGVNGDKLSVLQTKRFLRVCVCVCANTAISLRKYFNIFGLILHGLLLQDTLNSFLDLFNIFTPHICQDL
jgi:hypothetical protein